MCGPFTLNRWVTKDFLKCLHSKPREINKWHKTNPLGLEASLRKLRLMGQWAAGGPDGQPPTPDLPHGKQPARSHLGGVGWPGAWADALPVTLGPVSSSQAPHPCSGQGLSALSALSILLLLTVWVDKSEDSMGPEAYTVGIREALKKR